jgi:hypothetical protein
VIFICDFRKEKGAPIVRITIPFFVIGKDLHGAQRLFKADLGGDCLVAFSSAELASDYKQKRFGCNGEVTPISSAGLEQMVAELPALGIAGLCFDPKSDGSEGSVIRFSDIPI